MEREVLASPSGKKSEKGSMACQWDILKRGRSHGGDFRMIRPWGLHWNKLRGMG